MTKSELSVITKAKELCSYIMTVTEKSPKRFRFTLVSRLQNYALDVIENLIMANETFVSVGDTRSAIERMSYQRKAMSRLKLLSYMSELAMKQGCILPKQYELITKQIYDAENMLGAWMNSDKKRYGMTVKQ
ncbi:four helix bundle protein [Butyrivibrio sp.]|uniref:four helix bundle protein n=1 Tax=Butyrivibrio sp. TaxID=28121 RepID=UPI002ED64586